MRDRPVEEPELRRLMADGEDGRAADPREVAALVRLLRAASSPEKRPLRGEDAALAAFRTAEAVSSPSRRRRCRGRTTALSAAVAALLGCGVAAATAATGHLPFPTAAGEVRLAPSATVSAPPVSSARDAGGHTAPAAGRPGLPCRSSANESPQQRNEAPGMRPHVPPAAAAGGAAHGGGHCPVHATAAPAG